MASLCPTAAAIAGVISPRSPSATSRPMGPIMIFTCLQATITGFSPVAASSAPALIMAEVAIALVPMALTVQGSPSFLMALTSICPILPPCPSMTAIFIASLPKLSCGHYTMSTGNAQVKNNCSPNVLRNKHENTGGDFVGCVKCENFDFLRNEKCSLFFGKLQKRLAFSH